MATADCCQPSVLWRVRPGPDQRPCLPQCADALNWFGSVGPTSMRRALSEHLRANGRHEEAERLSLGQVEGLIGWGALAYAAMCSGQVLAANETRWAHVQVPQALSRRAGVRGGGQTPDMVEMVPSEARAFWKALMDNASALIADAHLLLGAGSYGRGKALTVLAQEELGKALWVYDEFETAWNAGDEQPRAVSRLAKHGTNHVVKYQEAIVFGHELAAFWGDWDAVEVDWSGDAVSRRREQAEAPRGPPTSRSNAASTSTGARMGRCHRRRRSRRPPSSRTYRRLPKWSRCS